jgi:hypothetical protein
VWSGAPPRLLFLFLLSLCCTTYLLPSTHCRCGVPRRFVLRFLDVCGATSTRSSASNIPGVVASCPSLCFPSFFCFFVYATALIISCTTADPTSFTSSSRPPGDAPHPLLLSSPSPLTTLTRTLARLSQNFPKYMRALALRVPCVPSPQLRNCGTSST